MTNYKEILRLHSLGINNTRIAESCGCARSTVIAALQRAAEQELSWNKIKNCSTEEVARKLYPSTAQGQQYKMPDYEWVHREMQKSGVTLSLLWVEYCEQCRQNGELPYKSTQFNKYYADYVHKTKATMHLEHKPGETMQVDWAGQTAALVDTDTGERLDAYLFVAALPYSGYAYTEAFLDMKQEAWITGHVNAYRYFDGVTRILTPDNLKTGVVKNSRTETVLNKAYQEMAEHYGTAILPARPRSPKDKAFVEGSVGVVSIWILAALRNRQFLSLAELNQAIREKLETFNHKPFQKREGSRAAWFAEEKLFLQPLPAAPFELAVWKVATVQYNYHISVERMNYSVPYEYIKQQVDVRLTRTTVEIFFAGTRIASHLRLHGRPNQYSTVEDHMPPDHQAYLQWNGERFIRWAEQIGQHTAAVVRLFLSAHKVEQQGYKSCMALLKLADRYSPQRLENACRKALSYTASPSLKSVQSILKSGQEKLLAFQSEEDSPEDAAKLPRLKLSDVSREPERIPTKRDTLAGTELLRHELATGGINYLTLYFDVSGLSGGSQGSIASGKGELGDLIFVSMALLTTTAPRESSSPLPSRKAVLGLTPRARMTRSHSRRELSVTTALTCPVPEISRSLVEVCILIPASFRRLAAHAASSASMAEGMIWSAMSMTVTSRPRCFRLWATSRPMKPAPATTARFTPSFPAQSLILSASSTVRRVNTPSRPVPGTGGTTGPAPVAMTSLS